MASHPALFEDSDLSVLPASDPGSNKPWKAAGATGFQVVFGAYTAAAAGLTQSQADARYAALSHTHTIAQVTGLQSALDAKQAAGSYAAAVHTHVIADVTGLQTAIDAKASLSGATFTGAVTMMAETRFGSNADRILQSSSLGYMMIETNTPMRLRATGFSIREFFSDVELVGIGTGGVVVGGSGALTLPSGTTAQRPASPVAGMQRWNTDTTRHEFWNGSAWVNHVRLSGDTMTGALSLGSNALTAGAGTFSGTLNANANLNCGGTLWANRNVGDEYIGLNNGVMQMYFSAGLQVGSGVGIDFSSTTAANGTADGRIIRSGTGQIDVRANSGLRVRNLANSADAAFTAGSGTFSGNVTFTNQSSIVFPGITTVVRSTSSQQLDLLGGGSGILVNRFAIGDIQFQRACTFSSIAVFASTATLGAFTVATLPSASANTRARAFVTDSSLAFTSANLGSTVSAGGSNLVPVWSNGTNWVIG